MSKHKITLSRVPVAVHDDDTRSDVYVIDSSFCVLVGNGTVTRGENLLRAFGIRQTEEQALALHLAGYGKESVLLCTGERPLLVACGLYARTGVLVVLATSVGVNDVVLYATDELRLLPGIQLPPSPHVPNMRYREDYNALLLATGRKEGSVSERITALGALTGAHLFRDDAELDTLDEEECVALLGILFLAALHAKSAGDGVLSFAVERRMGYAHVLLALCDDGEASLDLFSEMQRSAELRGMPFHVLRDEGNPKRVSLVASITIAELSVQGVKQPDGSTSTGIPTPQPIPVEIEDLAIFLEPLM